MGEPGMVTTARRYFSRQYLHYHRAGHGLVHLPEREARLHHHYVLAKMARLQGASGIHVGTMGYRKMEGGKDDRAIANIIEREEYQGPAYFQGGTGCVPPRRSSRGGMNALLRLPGFFENLGHANVINTAGGGSFAATSTAPPVRGPCARRTVLGRRGRPQLEWAKEHRGVRPRLESFPGDADAIYPGWREKLGVQ